MSSSPNAPARSSSPQTLARGASERYDERSSVADDIARAMALKRVMMMMHARPEVSARGRRVHRSLTTTTPASTTPATTTTTKSTSVDDDDDDDATFVPGFVPVVHHETYSAVTLPRGHRFPMGVFELIHQTCANEGVVRADGSNAYAPKRAPTNEALERAHCATYVAAVRSSTLSAKAVREIGLPWSDALVRRTLMEVSGTMLTTRLALKRGLAVNTAGGTHHANYDRGSGYCILNDLCTSAFDAIASGAVKKVMIVDLDVHQGDGTAGIVNATRRNSEVYTFSAHASSNFPARKEKSSRDVELARGLRDDEYLSIVSAALRESIEEFQPQLIIYDAGVDVTENDTLGHLSLSVEGLYRRERMVLDTALGAGIPLAGVVGGGYSPDLEELASRHCVLHRVAQEMFVDHGL